MGKGESSFKSTAIQTREDVPQGSGIRGFRRDRGDPPHLTSPFDFACVDTALGFSETNFLEGQQEKSKWEFSFKHEADNRYL